MSTPAMAISMRLFASSFLFLQYLLSTLVRLLVPKPPPSPLPASKPREFSKPHADDLSRLFRSFDRDNDGKITPAELSETLADLGIFMTAGNLAAAIAEVDEDGDGCVGLEEFGELYGRIVGVGGGDEEEEMREAFDVYDEDGDGFITAEELGAVLRTLGWEQGRVLEECRKMIGTVDVNGDGRVDFAEFKVMMGKSMLDRVR